MSKFYKSRSNVKFKVTCFKIYGTIENALLYGSHMPKMDALSLRIKSYGQCYFYFVQKYVKGHG